MKVDLFMIINACCPGDRLELISHVLLMTFYVLFYYIYIYFFAEYHFQLRPSFPGRINPDSYLVAAFVPSELRVWLSPTFQPELWGWKAIFKRGETKPWLGCSCGLIKSRPLHYKRREVVTSRPRPWDALMKDWYQLLFEKDRMRVWNTVCLS